MTNESLQNFNLAESFDPHEMPENSLPVRCHVLDACQSQTLEDFLVEGLPWCYITKKELKERKEKTGRSESELLANKFPDPGNVMSGDFGEIVTLFFLSEEAEKKVSRVKKWRYKQDRKKPAPHSDVIILYRENPGKPSKKDYVICAESKQKSTKSKFNPIEDSLKGYKEDKTGRLARTLVWLREKAIDKESVGTIDLISRFTGKNLTVEFGKKFKALAIVDRTFLDDEVTKEIELPEQNDEFEVVVIGIDNLKNLYEKCFSRAKEEVEIE
jgi:hypothetical protein